MAQLLTAKPIPESPDSGKESYEIHWTVPRYAEAGKSDGFVECQEALFETSSSPSAWFKTKWLVGLKLAPGSGSRKKAQVYWKLLEIHGPQSTQVEVELQTQLLRAGTGPCRTRYTDKKTRKVKLLETVEESNSTVEECLQIKPDFFQSFQNTDRLYLHSHGYVRFTLKLTLKTPEMSVSEHDRYKMEQFAKKSKDRLRRDQASLLYCHSENADLKFVTSDGVEIPAHKTILTARCPVFATMLNCGLSENTNGVIRLTDITAKTMKILLHYFYVGELLPSWRHPGTIVEFTYAAGKYQMTDVLELLDDMLGGDSERVANHLDVQLMNLTGKLKLENAETRLLERVVDRVDMVVTSGEVFRLFGYEEKEISEMADEKVGESRMLKMMDYLCGANDSSEVFLEKGMIMLALAQKKKLKKLEKKLLNRFAENAELVKNADELFDLFGRGKQMGNRD